MLEFAGRFQCRLPVDPDPFDEPYGLRGFAVALPGEPPLDRTICTAAGSGFGREGCPAVGVRVVGTSLPGHPLAAALLGAPVVLRPDATDCGPYFDGWNGVIAPLGEEPLSVLDLEVGGAGGSSLRRRQRAPRVAPRMVRTYRDGDLAARVDAVANPGGEPELHARACALEQRLATATDEATRAVVAARLDAVRASAPMYDQGFAQWYEADLDDVARLSGACRRHVDGDARWPVRLLFCCWDADSMTGVLAGTVELPLLP